jgi:hypothetical protein
MMDNHLAASGGGVEDYSGLEREGNTYGTNIPNG